MELGKFQILLNLGTGPVKEPAISNEEFLDSFVRAGAWLRILAAYQHYKTIADPSSSSLNRYVAIVSFYQLLGALYEDAITNLISWAVWTRDRAILLADVHSNVSLTAQGDKQLDNQPYHAHIVHDLLKSKHKIVRVNPQLYVKSLSSLSQKELLEWLGIPWKRDPSVKLVAKTSRDEWEKLPEHTHWLIKILTDDKTRFLVGSYNKLKHGPQLVLANVREIAVEKRGFAERDVKEIAPEGEYVRILLRGAQTQEEKGDYDSGKRVAPFLLHDAPFVEKMFFDFMVFIAFRIQRIAYWLLRGVYQRHAFDVPAEIKELAGRATERFRFSYTLVQIKF